MEDLVRTAGEREVLEAFLDSHRQVTADKLRGLSEADARRRLVPSATTPIGLVKHLTGVERNWLHHLVAGRPRDEIPGESHGGPESWQVSDTETVDTVLTAFEATCAESRQITAHLTPDHHFPHPTGGQVTLRWIYLHLLREHARHNGQADILREQIDGSTGA